MNLYQKSALGKRIPCSQQHARPDIQPSELHPHTWSSEQKQNETGVMHMKGSIQYRLQPDPNSCIMFLSGLIKTTRRSNDMDRICRMEL